jgi:hypothetical protein
MLQKSLLPEVCSWSNSINRSWSPGKGRSLESVLLLHIHMEF